MVAGPNRPGAVAPSTRQSGTVKSPPELSGVKLGIRQEKREILPEKDRGQSVPDNIARIEGNRMDPRRFRRASSRNGRKTKRNLELVSGDCTHPRGEQSNL